MKSVDGVYKGHLARSCYISQDTPREAAEAQGAHGVLGHHLCSGLNQSWRGVYNMARAGTEHF